MLKLLGNGLVILMTLAMLGGGAAMALIYHYSSDLPDYQQLSNYEPATVTRLYAADGKLLAEYAKQKRVFVPIGAIPKRLTQSFIAAEDRNFYSHSGIDPIGIARAALTNAINIVNKSGGLAGGSTITQQVVKNFLLTREKSIQRKVKEAILAFRITKAYSKDKILELYLNEIYLGYGSYGVAAAALNYFNKSIEELAIEEVAFLAALPKAPAHYNPKLHYDRAKARRDWVIGRMLEDHYITPEDAERAIATPIITRTRDETENVTAAFFAEEVRREIVNRYGGDQLYEGGLVVRTTLDPKLQQVAERALINALLKYDRRHGYRGPVTRLESIQSWRDQLANVKLPAMLENWQLAVVTEVASQHVRIGLRDGTLGRIGLSDMKWARAWRPNQTVGPSISAPADVLVKGDVIMVEPLPNNKSHYGLRQMPEINGAFIALDPHTGRVMAMVGGSSYLKTEFNRATQAKRQPGSAFKPFVYLSAMEKGYSPATVILDAPIELPQGPGLPMWQPQNYDEEFHGPTTLRVGLEKSRNVMTVRLAQMLGLKRINEIGKRFGIYEKAPYNYSMVLGSGETTLMKLTNAYASFVNGGKKVTPHLIERIQDRHGKTIYKSDNRPCEGCSITSADALSTPRVPQLPDTREMLTDSASAYQMVSMLEGVVQRGTGVRARKLGRSLAGKTGTTNDSYDTWFVGFSPNLVAGVYIGFDNPRSLGKKETGSSVALPAFVEFMRDALKDQPVIPFRIPEGVQLIKIDAATGRTPGPETSPSKIIFEAFKTTGTNTFPLPAMYDNGNGDAVNGGSSSAPTVGTGGLY